MPSASVVPAPERLVVAVDDRHRGAVDRRGVVEARDEDSVFCGLSFTVMPRFVTCTSVARVRLSPTLCAFGIGAPFSHRRPHQPVPRWSERASRCRGRATGSGPA